MLVSIGGVDITKYIDSKSYEMNSEADYKSWKDGWESEHRKYSIPKVKGSFTVTLYGGANDNFLSLDEFIALWNTNHLVTLTVFVENTNETKQIQAYYTFKGKAHHLMNNGNYFDQLTVEIKEK
jgi:hypothetical protein